MVEPVFMAASQIIIVALFIIDLENNSIEKAGCRWLSKTNWK
jgi:hypothetical protein